MISNIPLAYSLILLQYFNPFRYKVNLYNNFRLLFNRHWCAGTTHAMQICATVFLLAIEVPALFL